MLGVTNIIMFLAIAVSASFLVGSYFGWYFAQRGITADNALHRHQRQVYVSGSIALGIIILFVILMTFGRNSPWVPSFFLLYAGAYTWQAILVICGFCVGLMLLLEISALKDGKRLQLQQLIIFLINPS